MSNPEEKVVVQPRLRKWARERFENVKIRPTAEAMGFSASRLTDLLRHDDKVIGVQVLQKIARYTRTPEHLLLEMGEFTTRSHADTAAKRFLVYVFDQLDENAQKDLIAFAEHLRDRDRKPMPTGYIGDQPN